MFLVEIGAERPISKLLINELLFTVSDGFGHMLPACLLNAWDQAVACHLTELDTADAEHTHISLWTSSERTTVVHTASS
jgi:hypothetical protein